MKMLRFFLLLLPLAAWGQAVSPQVVVSRLPITLREYSIYNYGAVCNGSTDDGPAIQLAANAAATAGGGMVTGWGTCAMATAVSITSPRIVLASKHYGDGSNDVGSNDNGWTLKWTGSGGATMVQFTAVAGASNQTLRGAGAEGVTFDCNNSAGIGLQLLSVRGGHWESLFFVECTTAGLDVAPLGNSGTLGEAGDPQENRFIGLSTRILLSTGIGVRLRGSADGSANTSFNTFYTNQLVYKNGVGLQIADTDNNGFFDVQMFRGSGGSGIGVELTGSSAASARSNFFYDLSPGAGGITIRGTETNPNAVKNIQFLGYDITNAPPNPTIGTGVTGITIYRENGHLTGLASQQELMAENDANLGNAGGVPSTTTYTVVEYNGSQDGHWYGDGTSKILNRFDSNHNFQWLTEAGSPKLRLSAPAFNDSGGFASGGATFTLSSGTGACASTSTLTGGIQAGSFLCTGTAGASTIVVTLPTSPNGHGWSCWVNEDTSGVVGAAKSNGTTGFTAVVTVATSSDKVTFGCLGY